MPCYKIVLSTDQVVTENLGNQLKDNFNQLFTASKSPKDMALFIDKNKMEQYTYYLVAFSGNLIKPLAKTYGGEYCNQLPKSDSVILWAGNTGAEVDLLPK